MAILSPPACCAPTSAASLDLVEAIDRGWTYEATASSSDEGASFLTLLLTNPGPDAHVLIDAGTAFHGPDDIQPAVVTEDLLVYVSAGATEELFLTKACGSADAMGATNGMPYEEGVDKLPAELCRILDRMNEELPSSASAIQDLVWVYTDDHDFASVYVPEEEQKALLDILSSEVPDFEDPGYAVKYRTPDPDDGARFTGEAMEARCTFNVDMPRAMECTVVLLQPDGERLTLLSDFHVSRGYRLFTFTIGLEGYPPGAYTMQLESKRFGNTIASRDIHLQGRG